MDHNLSEAAQQGDVNALYAALSGDPYILDNLDSIPFFDTPLHIAASVGQVQFALEIMMLKPSLGRKLNQSGYSPMHLALVKGHEQLVLGLVSLDRDLVRVKGKDGRTPLHCLAITGESSSLLGDMIIACPDSMEDLTLKRETVLHLAVKYNQNSLTFEVLVECIKLLHKEEIFRWKDDGEYTALHYATLGSKIEMIKVLFEKYKFKEWNLGVDVKDGNGQTVVGMVEDLPETHEHRDSIRNIVILGTLEGMLIPQLEEGIWAPSRFWRYIMHELSVIVGKVPTDNRDALLVVLALVNTTSFQVGVNPPGGFWQDDGVSNGKHYVAGTPILATTNPALYFIISFFTMAGFVTSFNLIYVLTLGMPMKFLLVAALSFLSYSYFFAFIAITRKVLWIILTAYGLVSLFASIAFVVYMWKFIKLKILPALLDNDMND